MSVGAATLSGMKRELPSTLRYLAGNQSGVVSRTQALRAGLTADMIKFRARSGVSGRTAAVTTAIERGLLPPPGRSR